MPYFAGLRHKLGVEKGCTKEELKKAYKKASIKYHPDKNTGEKAAEAEKMMKKITFAYEILIDDGKMYEYEKKQRELIRISQKQAAKKKAIKKRRKKK
ncbi:DnaJ domain-containing protein [Candidatus Gracilibacteria bacterium]|nr:DnaJ domain-containing protein [Candidatus Gracilibacteria bacterium]